jgi:serine/threonine protein kinase
VMNSQFARNEEALQRFRREVILARKVSHPNVCRIYDMSESENIHYLSMEYLEGKTLAQLIELQTRLTPELGVHIIQQILIALQEAHRVGVIHRDLKPQNVMVDSQDRAYIMDFGISTSAEVSRLTQSGTVPGTIIYMAPEQLQAHDIDHRADLYAIGLMLFEALTGRLPFEATNPVEVIAAHLKGNLRMPSQIISNFPPELEKIISKSLEKNVSKRYQSADEFRQALEVWKNSIPSRRHIAEAPTADVSLPEASSSSKFPLLWLAPIVAMFVLAWIWFYVSRNSKPPLLVRPQVSVVVNALPWARVKLTPLTKDVQIQIPRDEAVTPCSLLLPAGEYSVELSNDGVSRPIVQRIQVKIGSANFFQFQMSSYDPRVVAAKFGDLK